MEYKSVDINNWNRQRTYTFYKDFDDPYFNVTVNVDITDFFMKCKSKRLSIYSNVLYAIMKAVKWC